MKNQPLRRPRHPGLSPALGAPATTAVPALTTGPTPLPPPPRWDGRIDPLFLVDFTGHYELTETLRLVGGVHNVFDERAVISRAPLDPRANAPRFVFAGFEARF